MRIGIDFDNTIVNSNEKLEEYMIKHHETDIDLVWEKYIDESTKELVLKDNAFEVLNELSKDNTLYLITARSTINTIKVTKEYIKDKNLPFKELYFECYGIDKLNKCLELGIDLFIDDDLGNVEATNGKIKTIYFDGDDDNYLCMNNWNDILKEVNRWKNE